MFKIEREEKKKIKNAIRKKKRKMKKSKLLVLAEEEKKKKNILAVLNRNEENKQENQNETDYVDFYDLKPEQRSLVERFLDTDKTYKEDQKDSGDEEIKEIEEDNNNINDEGKKQTKPEIKLSKKKMRQMKRMPVAQLKVLVDRPDLVESWDVTAKDPLLLMWLKSYKNTVIVPKHWSHKRKFLQNKRGIK